MKYLPIPGFGIGEQLALYLSARQVLTQVLHSMWHRRVGLLPEPLFNKDADHYLRHFLPFLEDFKRYAVGGDY